MSLETDRSYLRNPDASLLTTAGRCVFIRPGQAPLVINAVEPADVASLWEALADPTTGKALAVRAVGGLGPLLERLLGGAFMLRGAGDELAEWSTTSPAPESPRPCQHLVFGVTGAVQAVLVPPLLRRLRQEFAERIDVLLTPSAQEFLTPGAVRALGVGVWTEVFDEQAGVSVPHLELAASASLVLVLPATADAIFRLAHGATSDLVALVACATRAPVVVAPSMNPTMWLHPAVQRNVATLRTDGVFVLEPGPGASVADGVQHQVGGAGLGPDAANLGEILRTVLRLSR